MKLLREKYGSGHIILADDNPTLNPDWFEKLLIAIRREVPGMKWSCWARVNEINKDILEEMARSGCTHLHYGLESASDNVLDRINKNFTFDKAMEIIRHSVKYMNVAVNLIWGFPFETWKDFSLTCMAAGTIAKLKAIVSVFLLAPLPQSPLFDEYGKQIILHDTIIPSFGRAAMTGFLALEKDPMGPLALIRRYPEMFPIFYCYPTQSLEKKASTIDKLLSTHP